LSCATRGVEAIRNKNKATFFITIGIKAPRHPPERMRGMLDKMLIT
jgi:hypothetical protein